MLQKYIITFCLLSHINYAQELFFSLGKNYTKFKYTNSNGQTLSELETGTGLFSEFGLAYILNDAENNYYTGSLNYNQYNSKAYINDRRYEWETSYLGIKNTLSLKLFETRTSFSTKICLGFNLSHIIAGKQTNNGEIYKITANKEFKGIFLQPLTGVEFNYEINSDIYVSCGYYYSYSMNLNTSIEKLYFSTNQVQIGIHFKPK
jgi:hypothetical protein